MCKCLMSVGLLPALTDHATVGQSYVTRFFFSLHTRRPSRHPLAITRCPSFTNSNIRPLVSACVCVTVFFSLNFVSIYYYYTTFVFFLFT